MSEIVVLESGTDIYVTNDANATVEVMSAAPAGGVTSGVWVPDFVASGTPDGLPVPYTVVESGVINDGARRTYWFKVLLEGTYAGADARVWNVKAPGFVAGRLVSLVWALVKPNGDSAGSQAVARIAGDGMAMSGVGVFGVSGTVPAANWAAGNVLVASIESVVG